MNLNLHHVGVTVKEIPEAAALYLRLGYEPRTGIIHDPEETAYVQFLRLPGDRAYLELIAPDRQDSKLSGALKRGGGLNHLCFATEDIETACERLCAEGFFLISSPVSAVAFHGRRIAWLMGPDRVLTELVESGPEGEP
ncbi:MAG TPA: VOC family protein [Terriglobia bacterium]|nr:VOC family protein [Terriglobia bacterium]